MISGHCWKAEPHPIGRGAGRRGNAVAAALRTAARNAACGTIRSVGFPGVSYREQLEAQLQDLIGQIDGAGATTVMVTLETGEETIYATDTQSGQTQSQETHVLLDDGTALAQTVYYPQVCGVAVVCDGGGDVRVAARITELVRALLDISSTRICVEQRRP